MNDKVRAIILHFTDYLNRHDAEAASKLFAENVLVWEPSYDAPRHGRAAVRREFEGFFAMLPDIEFTPLTLLADGDHAFQEWRYQATYQGRPIELRECAIVRFDYAPNSNRFDKEERLCGKHKPLSISPHPRKRSMNTWPISLAIPSGPPGWRNWFP